MYVLCSLIPTLMNNMKYDDSDAIFIDYGDDEELEDKDEDIKPRHHRTRTHEAKKENAASENQGPSAAAADDEDDEDEEDEDSYREWNLRKCSAATIDSLSYCEQKAEYLQVFLPTVNQKLCSTDWLELESGILALGAISDGTVYFSFCWLKASSQRVFCTY